MTEWYELAEMGKKCQKEGRLDDAERLLRKAAGRLSHGTGGDAPGSGAVYFELGKCCFIGARYREAIEHLEKSLQSDPASVETRLMLAKSYKMRGEYAQAGRILAGAREGNADGELERERREVAARMQPAASAGAPRGEGTKGFRKDIPPYRACVTWFLNHRCNYRCSYCQSDFREPPGFRTLAPRAWYGVWEKLHEKYGRMAIQATGGEPTVYPGFFDVLRGVSELHAVELQTNLSWEPGELIRSVPPERVSRVGASFHREWADFDVFLGKMRALRDAGYKTEITCVAFPPFLDGMRRYLDAAMASGIPIMFLSFQGIYDAKRYPESYREEELATLRRLNLAAGGHAPGRAAWDVKHKVVVDRVEENGSDARSCRMGQMYAWVRPDGRTMRCCKSPVSLGNLIEGTFELLEEARPCALTRCICFRSMVVGEEPRWERQWPGCQ